MQRAKLSVTVSDFHCHLLIVRHDGYGLDLQFYFLCLLLLQSTVINNVDACGKHLCCFGTTLKQHSTIQHCFSVFVSKETSHSVFLKTVEQFCYRIISNTVLAQVLFTEHLHVCQTLVFQQSFDVDTLVRFPYRLHLL